jgi:signal transduction histidine kinase
LVVKDNGVGIDPVSLQKIFRIDSKHSTRGTDNEAGTGLGLALCREFAEKNGGGIRAESQIGAGTSFILSLPAGH